MATDRKQQLSKEVTLAELIDTHVIRCDHCHAPFNTPLLLPCLHTFCKKCVLEMIVVENVDQLRADGKLPRVSKRDKAVVNGDDVAQGEIEDSDKSTTISNSHIDNHASCDKYTFTCPTCKSAISIDNGGHLETSTTAEDQKDVIISPKSNGDENEGENAPPQKSSSSSSSKLVQSFQITQSKYQRLQHAIRFSLPSNHFMESVTGLYRYKHEASRECAYCKTEDVVELATCLCLQCHDDVCDACAGAHRKTRITRDHSVVPYTAIQEGLFDHDIRQAHAIKCQEHNNEDVTHFCDDCLKVFCKQCRSKHHHNHKSRHLTEAASTLSTDIQTIQEGLTRRVPDLEKYIHFLTQQTTSLEERHRYAAEEISSQVRLIHKMVDEWKDSILTDMETAVGQERQLIQDKIDIFKVSKSSTEKVASFLLHLFNLGKADEKMASYACVMRRYQQLVRIRPKAMTSRLGIAFTPGPSTDQNIRILIGQLGIRQEDLLSQDTARNRLPISTLMPPTLETPLLTKAWTLMSSSSQSTSGQASNTTPYISGIDIKGNLMASVDRNRARVIVQDYSTQKVLKEFSGSGTHKLKKPFDVAFLPSGALAITDPEASAVRAFDWTGKYLFTFDAEIQQNKSQIYKGRRDKDRVNKDGDDGKSLTMRHPRGITVTQNGEVIVLDGHLRHCTVHDSNTGKILWTIYPHKEITTGDKQCNSQNRPHPSIITKKDDNKNEPKHNDTKKYDFDDSKTDKKSTEPQLEQHQDVILVDPFYICTSPEGHLIITDAASPNVKILGWPSGALLMESIDYGIRQEECLHPAGVCVDHKAGGYILLADTNNNRIHLGLPDGHFASTLIPGSTKPADDDDVTQPSANNVISCLSHPTCLCLDQDGQIVVGQVGGKFNVYKYI